MPWGAQPLANAEEAADAPGRAIRLKLETPSDLRKALARLIRMSLNGALPSEALGRYANAISILHRITVDSDALDKLRADVAAIEGRLA